MRSPIDRLVAAGSRSAARAKNFSPSERSSLRRDVLALVREGNESVAPERQVTYRSAARVVNRALRESASLEPRSRRVAALRALSAFISLSVNGAREGVEPRNTDLLPVGHPLSSAPHAMTASALRRSRAQWLSVDPRIADDVRPLVASAFSHEPGTIESQHALTRLSALPAGSVPAEFLVTDTLEALIADGNSRAARSARARAQRRDRKGRFAEMGGGVRLLLGRNRFDMGQMVTGRVVGYPDDGVSLDLQLPDGSIVRVPADKTEGVRAILPDSALPDNPNVGDGPDGLISDDFELVVASYVDAPAGWRKVDAESSDGVTTFTDDEYKITRYDKIDKELGARVNKAGGANQKNPGSFDLRGGGADPTGKWNKDLPLYEIRNEETGKVVGYAQDWADTLGIVDDNATAMDAKKAGDAEVKAKLDADKAATDAEVAEWSSKRQSDYAAHVEERKDALEAQIADGVDAQGRPVPSNWSPELPGTYDSPRAPEAPGSAEERSAYNYEKSNPDAVPSFDKSSADFIDDVEYSTDLNGDRVTVSQRDGKLELDGESFDDWDGVQAALPGVAQKRYDASRERMANALEKVGVDKSIVDMVRDGASKDDVSAALSDDETWSDAQNDLATSGDVDLPQKYQRDAWDATREANDALNGLKNEPQIAELPGAETSISPRYIGEGDMVRTADGKWRKVKRITRNNDESRGYQPGSLGNTEIVFEDGHTEVYKHDGMNDQRVDVIQTPKNAKNTPTQAPSKPVAVLPEKPADVEAPQQELLDEAPEPVELPGEPVEISPRYIGEGDWVQTSNGEWRKVKSVDKSFDESRGYKEGSVGNSQVLFEDGHVEVYQHAGMNDQRVSAVQDPKNAPYSPPTPKDSPQIAELPGAQSESESKKHPYLSRDKRFPDLEKMSDEELEEAIQEANDFMEKAKAGEESFGPGEAERLKAWLKAIDREKRIRAANLDVEDRKAARALSQRMYDIERGGMSFVGLDGKVIAGDDLDMKRALELQSAAEKLEKIFNPDMSGGKAKGKLYPGIEFEVTEDGQEYPGGRVPGQIIISGPGADKLDPAKMEELGFTLDYKGRWVKDRPLGKPNDVKAQVSADLAEAKALAEGDSTSSEPDAPEQPEQIAELPGDDASAESTWEPADTRQTIPWETLVFDEETGKAKLESGEAEIIDYAGRKIVVMDINGTKVPFYLSTGAGGKAGVEAGRWYPFFGIGEDGWINKLGEAEINDYYDSPELRAAAEWLDANVGDVRDDTSIPKTKATGDHVDFINSDLDAADNEKSDTRAKVDANIDKVRDGVRKDASAPEIELPEAPEITELPAPVSSKSFDFDVPEGAHRLELDFFDPEGRTDQDSPDYTDDPRVLAQKFSDEQLTDALAEAIIAQKNFADTFLEQLDSEPLDDDVDDAAPKKKGKTGPKPKKKISTTASGLGKLSFEYGDEFVPAEALYLALQERGADVDMIVADMYDMRAGDTKNRDALSEARGDTGAPLEVGQDQPELLPELDEIFDEAEDIDEPEAPEAPYISDRQQQSLSIVAAIDAIDVDSLDPAVKELNDLILSLEFPANEDEAAENLDRITDEIAPALYAVLTDTATDTERAKVQAWWGIFSHLDNGDGAEDSIAVSAMAHSVAVYMGMDIGDEDAMDELNRRIYSTLGSSRDFKNSKAEFANGDTGGEMYGAFAQFLATAASPNENTLYRGMDVSAADEDFKLFTTEGSVVNFDPTSWSQSQSTADMYAKRYYPPQGDRVGVIFKLDPGEGTSVNMERYSWYFGEHEDVTWGQYVVDSVVESEGEAFTGEKKITYEVNLRPMTMSEWARYSADGDYSSLLADNVDIDFPEGYHTPSADAYEPEFPEGDNYEGVPEGFTDSPLYLAEMWETDDLIDQLRAGIEDGSGFGTFEYPLDDGFEANVPVEAIRDALQIQGFDTNEILRDIADVGDGVDADTETDEPDVEPAESIAANETSAIRDESSLSEFDISGWKQVGGQLGSNPGGFYEDEDGNRYYVKYPKSRSHAENEVLASAMYRAAGVDAAGIYFGRDADGELVTVSPLIDGATTDFASRLDDPQYKDKTQAGFAVDAWLANWDVAGLVFDNVVTDADGNPVRVDPGGALVYRAQGAPKGGAFGNEVTELDTLRDPSMNPQSYAVFGDMSNDAARESARKLLPMTPDKIEDMVNAVVTDPELAKELSDKLKARRQYIIDYFSLNDEQSEAQVSNYIDTEKDLPPGASAPEPAGVPDDYAPPVVTADEPEAPAPAASTATDAYLSSDGTPLQIGMKVRSTKDGLEGEVVKFDKNPKYVFVKDASGKKIVRSTKTLEIVTDSGAPDVTPEPELVPEPDATPVPEPEASEPTAPATYQDVFQSQMDALNELAKNNPYEVPIADIADALGISPYSDMYEYLAKRHPSFFENNGNPDSIPTSLLADVRDGFSSDGSDDVDRIVQDVVLNGPKAAQEYDLMPIGDAYMELRASMLDSENDGSYSDADLRDVVIANRTAIEEAMYNGDLYVTIAPPGGYEVNLDLRAAIPVLQTTSWKPPPVKNDFSDAGASMPDAVEAPEPEPEAPAPQQPTIPDLSLPYMEPAGKVVKSVSKSQLEATDYSGTVGDGISYEIKGEMVAHYNAWGKYDGNTAGVTLTLKGKTFPIKDALKKAGYRYDGSTKSWSITKKPGLGTGDIDDALASIYAGLEKIGPVTGEHYDANFKEDVPDVDAPTSDDGELADWEKELLGIDATSDAAEPSDLTPPPGAPTLPDANGNPIWVGAKVVDAQGNEGTVTKLQPNGAYVDVKFSDGTKKARSIKKVVVSGTGDVPVASTKTAKPKKSTKPTPTGAPAVVVDEPLNWNESSFDEVNSLSGALATVRQDTDSSSRGASFAADAGDIEDLDVRVMRVLDENGNESIMLKYRLTDWAGADLAKKLYADPNTKVDNLNVKKMKTVEALDSPYGMLQLVDDASYKSWAGRTLNYDVDTASGTAKITVHRANTSDSKTLSKDSPRAFHNLVQIVLPGNATEADIADALKAAGINDVRPATPDDAKIVIENRVLSVFGKETNPAKNLKGPAREQKLQDIYDSWGFTADDVRVVRGADGRVEYRLTPEVAQKIMSKTGVKAIKHNLTPPAKTPSGRLLHSGSTDERREAWLEYYLLLFGGNHDGLLSTSIRWSEGVGYSGMSSNSDVISGGADYVFTTPKSYRPDNPSSGAGFNPTIVFRADSLFERLDIYANQYDSYGKRSNTHDIIKNINGNTYELMFKNRLSWEDLDFVSVPDETLHGDLIAALKARGIFSLGGIPIEQIFLKPGDAVPDLTPEERAKFKAAMQKIAQ